MAKPLTTTSYAILGLLRLRSWTSYELAKQVQKSLGWFWPRAERKLYDEPKNLVALGLATATDEHTGNRPRTVYAITPAGRKALRGWLGHTPEPPALEWVQVPAERRYVSKRLQESNYLQALEGGIDSSHVTFLHGGALKKRSSGRDPATSYSSVGR